MQYGPPEDVFTNPISLGLRIGQPAVASPETTDLPVWAGKPDVPAPTVQHHPRRSLALWLLDEGVLLVLLVAGLFGLSALIAVYVQ